MRKSIAATALIAALAATAGCGHARGEDPGPTVSRNYTVGDFQEIEVAGSYDVEVRTGSKVSVSAQGGEKLLEKTEVKVEGDKLVIRPEGRHGMFNFGWGTHRGSAKFVVTVPQLKGATIAGSGGLHITNVQGDSFSGAVAGSGQLDIDSMNVQSFELSIAGSGGAKAAGGQAQSGKINIAGSGDLDLTGVQARDLDVSVAGSGNLRAKANGAAQVSIMGSGDVTITGGAKCQVSKMGSGSANCS